MTREESFRVAISAQGIGYGGELYFDGRLHRFKAGDDKAKNCWYVLYNGPVAVGAFGCWKRGIKEKWCERNGNLSLSESQAVRACWEEAASKLKAETAALQRKARKLAAWIVSRSRPARAIHRYLERKRIKVFGDVREYRGALVLPLRDEKGELHSLQFIREDGVKKFLRGGRVAGCFFTLADKADGLLVLCEGYATGATIHEATGHAVFCGLNSGNLLEVAKALRALWPQREILIAADNDQFTEGNPGQKKATAAAKAISARVVVPQFKELAGKPTDFNDLAVLETLAAVREQIAVTQVPLGKETDEETIARLAALSKADYERVRDAEALKLGWRVAVLDDLVYAKRPRALSGGRGENLQGEAVVFVDVEPWPEPVNGAEVLEEISKTFSAYVTQPSYNADTVTLWSAHTHCFSEFQCSPRLNITSPEGECGKTTERDLIGLFCWRPQAMENLTSAVLFRIISAHHPTILADECDKWIYDNVELQGLFNAGHRKGGKAYRIEGEAREVRSFDAYAPTVLCGLNRLPGTLPSRSITIRLERASKEEKPTRFDFRHLLREKELCRKLVRWITDNRIKIAACDPVLPEAAFNRVADNWRPLFAIAEVAGGDWPGRCLEAFEKLTRVEREDTDTVRVMLLTDIQKVFNGEWPPPLPGQPPVPVEHIFTKDLIEKLLEMKERPWPDVCRGGKPITARWLASNLAAFGIHSRNIWVGEKQLQAKGYERAQFDKVFAKYIPEDSLFVRNPVPGGNLSVQPSNTIGKTGENLSVQQNDFWTDEKKPIYEAFGRLDASGQGVERVEDKEDDVSEVPEPQPGEESPPESESLSGDLRL